MLNKLGIPKATFYGLYELFLLGGIDALEDNRPLPGCVWKWVRENVRREIVYICSSTKSLPNLPAVRGGVPVSVTVRQYHEKPYSLYTYPSLLSLSY